MKPGLPQMDESAITKHPNWAICALATPAPFESKRTSLQLIALLVSLVRANAS